MRNDLIENILAIVEDVKLNADTASHKLQYSEQYGEICKKETAQEILDRIQTLLLQRHMDGAQIMNPEADKLWQSAERDAEKINRAAKFALKAIGRRLSDGIDDDLPEAFNMLLAATSTPDATKAQPSDGADITPLACDWPQCECSYNCERNDKHEDWVEEQLKC